MRGVEQIPWIYDAICAFAEWRGLGRWRRWLVGGARGRTLDLGSGTGRNLPLYPTGVQVVGVEPSAARKYDDGYGRMQRSSMRKSHGFVVSIARPQSGFCGRLLGRASAPKPASANGT